MPPRSPARPRRSGYSMKRCNGSRRPRSPSLPAGSAPLPLDWTTLAELRSLETALPGGSPPQAIPGGDFEDLNVLLQSGWQRIEQPPAGVKTAVRLSPEAPGQGTYCLELQVLNETPGGTPPALPAAPVWVTSPPLQTPPGHLVEINGLVRVAEAPLGLADPLVIFDSVGGEEGAIRVESSPAWRPFRMLRVPTPGAEMRLTIALGGVGRAGGWDYPAVYPAAAGDGGANAAIKATGLQAVRIVSHGSTRWSQRGDEHPLARPAAPCGSFGRNLYSAFHLERAWASWSSPSGTAEPLPSGRRSACYVGFSLACRACRHAAPSPAPDQAVFLLRFADPRSRL